MARAVGLAILLILAASCGTTPPRSGEPAGTARSVSVERVESPSPFGTPVAAEVLPPATTMPAASLCTFDIYETADGNFEPRFCSGGSINVVAWRKYAAIGPHILAAGKDASAEQIDAAIRADSAAARLTNIEILDAYQLAAAYYGWKLSPNPACELLYEMAACY